LKTINLTINIDANDKYFDDLKNIEKLNIGDIIKRKGKSLLPNELEQKRAKIIAETINDSKGDLLIGFAIREEGQIEEILKRININDLSITKIYFANSKRQVKEINEYKKNYNLHSNWMDFPTEFVENQYKIFEEKVTKIKTEAVKNGIKIVGI